MGDNDPFTRRLQRLEEWLLGHEFIRDWVRCLNALFRPNTLLFLILWGSTLCLSLFKFRDPPLTYFLSITSSVFLLLAGGFVERYLGRSREEEALKRKGLSAIRNLGALEKQLKHLRGWIETFISGKASKKRDLSEIGRHLGTMQLSIQSGLEDWVDIVPELKKLKKAEERYSGTIEAYVEEILESKKKLLEAGEDKESREKLELRIRELEDSVEKLREERPKVLSSAVSGTPLVDSFASGGVWDPSAFKKTCSRCGRTYQEDPFAFSKQGTSFGIDTNLCPECERIQKSPEGL